ncbi:hypothetical protein CC80DRAFT_538163 [Byssothecium circinans]|uniref:Rhodopsin domain-containing protein n=1 Tax=Byssothecium circinans TaxID=147558 RepID=A0A6A5TI99_9PLEO|nr:hypothetical protein CC80DRAFT_538163 [Byssothecium circinans]
MAEVQWEDQRLRILIPTTILAILATIFLAWRCVYGLVNRRKFMICDYLLILSWMMAIVNVAIRFILVDTALGRHINDPSIGPANLLRYSYYLWINQIINIIAVAVLKLSICTYLLVLDFSKTYRIVVWISIVLIVAFNLFAQVFTLFGCAPLDANWNIAKKAKAKCWAKGSLPLSYTQGIINVLTDVVYIVAPLIYLSQVQLPKRTQWGLRVVFLLSIAATICSIFKTIELKTLTKTRDPTWDGTNLAIWSGSELYVGILIASLPPLRKAFDSFFRCILPSTARTTGYNANGGYGKTYGGGVSASQNIKMGNFTKDAKSMRSGHPGESVLDSDGESERAILDEESAVKSSWSSNGIRKTTDVTVVSGGV